MRVGRKKHPVAPARGPGRSMMGKLAGGLFIHTHRGRIEYGRPCRPVVRLLRFIDIQLWLPQLRACYATIYGNGGAAPTQHFRAVGPGSPVGQDASACPRLRACAASRIALHWSLAARRPASPRRRSTSSGHQRKHKRRGRTAVRTFLIHPPPDLPGQRRDEFQSGSFRVRFRHPPAIIRHRQTTLSVTTPATSLTLILPPASGPNACFRLLVATSFKIRPSGTARSIDNSSSSACTSMSMPSACCLIERQSARR